MESFFWHNTKSLVRYMIYHVGEKRAVKAISKENVADKEIFASEVQILKKLDHPNIIKLYEVY